MFQIQGSPVKPGLCLNKNRTQIALRSTNTCVHTLHAHVAKHTEDSLLPFLAQTLNGVWPTRPCVSKKHTH